jgi:NAD(P)-dependent dehydrogenase (short-subunit alcohol dehydrogenase family)
MSRRSFDGRTVLVTGAGGGLGRALARRFAAAGAHIVAVDRDPAGIDELAGELASSGHQCLALGCDVTDAFAVEASVTEARRRFGGIDVLVNNAGISHRSPFERTRPEVIRKVMEVNFFGSVHFTQAALPQLLERGGMIIVISSVAGFAPLIARTGYAASKHALHGFFESLRPEVAPAGVDVMLVCPSFISTDIDRNALGADGHPVKHAQVVIGRRLTPEAAANRIFGAASRSRRLLRIGRTADVAWWVSRIAPAAYERGMARRLRGEMESP